jgi:hypothetical protein
MNGDSAHEFLSQVESALRRQAVPYQAEILILSAKSLKVRFHLREGLFLAVRYNARNGRIDFALIRNEKRIYGCDNLKTWHYHPLENPALHVSCDQPELDNLIKEIHAIIEHLASAS